MRDRHGRVSDESWAGRSRVGWEGGGATDDAGVLSPLPWSSEARPVP
jgi:hypothetical protein